MLIEYTAEKVEIDGREGIQRTFWGLSTFMVGIPLLEADGLGIQEIQETSDFPGGNHLSF